ncbi:BMP family ABC transporter substrate-binding protein [Paenibacillus chitinolyticus]|uniref:BMP family ABC transporter substrate-binding protein n=2 Tax=Paenibacillus chitinolyticus TaxID=79263 RepID=A0A410WPC2_9BACL|nr:BMP family ABC transporter substrate-binding protein [Paenibacillus chitinolyticus]MCY9590756.1 BMP family ABC transporter substrate-binding protein [Paenibacillus chitinolyticus]QAV16203.1 BMP family ABC transporter substrate-binding protein [Paenibacillus chitinolyticus]
MKKFFKLSLVMMLAFTLVLAGCGKKADNGGAAPSGNASGGEKKSDVKIGMVTDVGGVNDKSFNQSAWEALEKLKKDTGISTKYLQSKADSDYVPNLNQFVQGKYNLTWGIGFVIADAMKTVAQQNPTANFAIIDNVVEAPNVQSITFAENEGSFLVGVVAAKMTKSNKIGFVGGMDIPVIKRFEAGFKAGVAAVNPDAKVLINYTGAFDKPDLGKAAAATMYNDGADIIFHSSGATGNGVFNEANDRIKQGKKVWVIGVDKDQSLEFGDQVTLTSMVKGVEEAVTKYSKMVVDGNFKPGAPVTLGLKDNGVGLASTSSKNVPADVLKLADEYKEKIIKGEIKVPEQ